MEAGEFITKVAIVVGVISGAAAYDALPNAGIIGALIVLFGVAWLLYQFREGIAIWNFFGLLISPPVVSLIGFFSTFAYLTVFQDMSLMVSLLGSFAGAVFGFTAGAFLFKYWNMGP